ncbi:MAG: TPM domain-containing protein [Oscillospiraceae bacterium]|jgi:uncharacterized protein|nr:TPM domain-containing protein [Oscillospiraceae bacterium]
MKKRIASFVLILLVAVNFSGFALADKEEGPLPEGQRISGLVIDQAGLLTEDELEELSDRAATITGEYQCSVCILTVQSIGDSTRREYAKAFYQQNQMGYGEEQSGILFMVSMENREYVTITYGYGITAFTDYGIEQLEHALLPDLSDGQYFSSFSLYLDKCQQYLEEAAQGTPVDVGDGEDFSYEDRGEISLVGIGGSLLIALLVALIVCWCLIRQMKTAAQKREADRYVPEDGFQITGREDLFLYTVVTRTRRQKDHSDSGGSSVDSDGFGGSDGGNF